MHQIDASLVAVGGPLLPLAMKATWAVLSSQNAAAWVQAVGSVAAILVAAWLPVRQRRLEAADARRAAGIALREAAKALRGAAVAIRQANSPNALVSAAQEGVAAIRLVKVAVEAQVGSAWRNGSLEAVLLAAYRLGAAVTDLASVAPPIPSQLEAEKDRLAKALEADADAIRKST